MKSKGPKARNIIGWLAASWLAALVIVIIVIDLLTLVTAFFIVDVCDDELSQSGSTVEVCRHLGIEDPPVVAGGLAAIALLGVFFQEISGFGISLKRTAQAAKDEIEAARDEVLGASASVQREAELVSVQTEVTSVVADRQDPGAILDDLAREYSDIRREQKSGEVRTAKMTSVVSRMVAALEAAEESFDLDKYLSSSDRGLRLAAYAYLYSHPRDGAGTQLADTILEFADENMGRKDAESRADRPFGTYWGLRALRKVVEWDPNALDEKTLRRLESLLDRLGPATDRAYELRRILKLSAAKVS